MTNATQENEQLDVVIIGGGLSGIAAAYYLQRHHPQRSYAILESREATGGTWDLFRYPGIRSDSDLHTLGYAFKPWVHEDAIARGDDILAYMRETATEHGIDPKIRMQHRVASARFKSEDARWSLEVERGDTGESVRITCRWIFCATGYYIYEEGFTPAFEGPIASRGRSPPPALARGPRLRGQAGGRDRQRRHRDDAHPGDHRQGRARDDAPAIAKLRDAGRRRRIRSRTCCAGSCPTSPPIG